MKKKFKNVAIPENVHKLVDIYTSRLGVNIYQYVSDTLLLAVRSKLVIPDKMTGLRIKFVEKEEK